MIKRQTVVGFFDHLAEAQQAVQRLLALGFTGKTVTISTQTGLPRPTGEPPGWSAEPATTGRFLLSLFGPSDEVGSGGSQSPISMAYRSGTLVTIQTQSVVDVLQVTALLDLAGAREVAATARQAPDEGTGP